MDNLTQKRHTSSPTRTPLSLVSQGGSITPLRTASGHAHWADRFARNADAVTPRQSRWFASLMGVAAVAITAQAAIAGEFNSNPGNSGWVFAHGLISYVTLAATLAAAVFTLVKFRRTQRAVTILAVGMFVLTVAQTIVWYLITVAGASVLLVIHIPLAFIIFGLAGWLSVKAGAITGSTHRRFRG